MSFQLIRKERYEDLNCTLTEYRHESGLRHFHLDSQFPEMNFNLALPTPPVDDTGMPHILEHLTLCGSHKYPEKDPFMKMNNRSVSHFMNAMTAPMHTYYPFSTTLEKDFLNLSDVYLDLIFNPLLRKEDFLQEGWRLDKDKDGVAFKGVVLNEMKGVYSSPSWARRTAIMNEIAPHSPLRFSSGGHPSAIVHLDFDRLKQFHETHYRPENAVLSTSGDFDVNALHEQLNDVISSYQARSRNTPPSILPPPPKAIQEIKMKKNGKNHYLNLPGDQGDKRSVFLAYATDAPTSLKDESFNLLMIHSFLLSPNPHSKGGGAFKRLEEKYGIQINWSYESTLLNFENQFVVFALVENVDESLAPILLEEIDLAWQEALKEGMSDEQWLSNIDDIFNHISKKEDSSHQSFVSSIAERALMGKNPFDEGNTKEILHQLKSTPSIDKINEWSKSLLSNKVLSVISHENQDFMNNVEKSLKVDLQEKVLNQDITTNTQKNSKDNKSNTLPIIQLDDIYISPKKAGSLLVFDKTTNHAPHTHISAPTKEPFVEVNWSMGDDFTKHEKMILNVFTFIAGELGTKDEDSQSQVNRERKNLVRTFWHRRNISNNNVFASIITCTSSCPPEKFPHATQSLLDRTAGMPVYEEGLFVSNLKKVHSSLTKQMVDMSVEESNSSSLAMVNNESRVTYDEHLYNKENQLLWVEKAIENPKKAYDEINTVLKKVFTCPRHITSAGDESLIGEIDIVRNVFSGGENWSDFSLPRQTSVPPPPQFDKKYHMHQSMVNHCFRSMKGPSNKDLKEFATLKIAAALAQDYLHEVVRERGGAYGSSLSTTSNTILFRSFRDPNVDKTYEAFDGVYDYLLSLDEDNKDQLLEAKLSLAKNLLAPLSPSAMVKKQFMTHMLNHEDDVEQKLWEHVKNVTIKDIKDIAQKWLSPSNPSWDAAAVSRSNSIWKNDPISPTPKIKTQNPA